MTRKFTFGAAGAWTASFGLMLGDTLTDAPQRLADWAILVAMLAATLTIIAHRARHMVTVRQAYDVGRGLAEIVSLDEHRRQREGVRVDFI